MVAEPANEMREEVRRQLYGVIIWAVAFAFVEAAVVVYLRRLFYPAGFTFPVRPDTFESILGVEIDHKKLGETFEAALLELADDVDWEQ